MIGKLLVVARTIASYRMFVRRHELKKEDCEFVFQKDQIFKAPKNSIVVFVQGYHLNPLGVKYARAALYRKDIIRMKEWS